MISLSISLALSLLLAAQIAEHSRAMGFYLNQDSAFDQASGPAVSGLDSRIVERKRRLLSDVNNIHDDITSDGLRTGLDESRIRQSRDIAGPRTHNGQERSKQHRHREQVSKDSAQFPKSLVKKVEHTQKHKLIKQNHINDKIAQGNKPSHDNDEIKGNAMLGSIRNSPSGSEFARKSQVKRSSISNTIGSSRKGSRMRRTTQTVMLDRSQELEREIQRLQHQLDVLEHRRMNKILDKFSDKHDGKLPGNGNTHTNEVSSDSRDVSTDSDDVSGPVNNGDVKRAELAPMQMEMPDHDFRVRPRFYPEDGPKRNWKVNLMRVWG